MRCKGDHIEMISATLSEDKEIASIVMFQFHKPVIKYTKRNVFCQLFFLELCFYSSLMTEKSSIWRVLIV